MKKILIPVIIILLLGVGFLVFNIALSYRMVQYEKDALAHVIAVEEGGELIAEYNGISTKVLGDNIYKIKSVLTVSEKDRLFIKPDFNSDESITLSFSDGAEYIIAYDNPDEDSVFVLYNYNIKNYYTRIEGYKTFYWIEQAISPEGINTENIIIE